MPSVASSHGPLARSGLAVRMGAFVLAVAAIAPYVVLKVLWLSGSRIGMRDGNGFGEMHDPRFVVGNLITVGLSVVAVVFAYALTRGRLVPAWLVLMLGAGACGLLAPIAVGLPIGVLLQVLLEGTTRTGGEGNLQGGVFATVYIGFAVLGICLAVLLGTYLVDRWRTLLSRRPQPPSTLITALGGIGLLGFAAAMVYWGVIGPGSTGPVGFQAVEQRTVLVVTGLLAAAGFATPLVARQSARFPRLRWLITWTGCCTAAFQGPTLIALAHDGIVPAGLLVLTVMATPAAAGYGLAVLRASR